LGRQAARRLAAAIAVAVSVIGGAGFNGAARATTSTDVASPPAPPPVQLPAPATVGQQADVAVQVGHAVAAGTFEVVLTMGTAVTAVNEADLSYTTRSTISTVDVTVGAEIVGDGVNNLNGQSFEQSFAGTGAAVPQAATLLNAEALAAAQQDSGRALIEAVSLISVGFPAEPVTVGSAWTSDGAVSSHGLTIPVSYQCRLTALTDSTYTMEVTYTQPFSETGAGGAIEATVAGWGTITGSVSNPLVISASLDQTIDGIQGVEPLHEDTTITLNATAR
jgi:hypothetical protein